MRHTWSRTEWARAQSGLDDRGAAPPVRRSARVYLESVTLRTLSLIAIVALAGLVATACGTDSLHDAMGHDESSMMSHDASQMGTGRTADAMFTQEMIPHHQQAIAMADLALDPARGARPEVQDLARRIKAAQTAEVADMRTWLREWGAADDAEQTGHMDHGDMNGMGMLSDTLMTALGDATGADFDRLWLEGMIAHHQGALMMASHISNRGADTRVHDLSGAITESQTAEIAEMRRLLGS